MQHTSQILMIKPVNFNFNEETAVNNSFQSASSDAAVPAKAAAEFDNFVDLLRQNGILVMVVEDTPLPHTPDSVFPNNWISFHSDGTLVLYPMYAKNRRLERKQHVLQSIEHAFRVNKIIDLSSYESTPAFLEGTGSMVLDRDHRIAYACLSPRTNQLVLEEFCKAMGYSSVCFTAVDDHALPIYHTNVMMCVADSYAVICLDSISAIAEKEMLISEITKSGKQIIPISYSQMNHFAGNMLQVHNVRNEKLLVMSTQAYHYLTDEQLKQLNTYNRIIHADISTIESNGGGSARCMMAEIFLPQA
jgi:hypothetical protein